MIFPLMGLRCQQSNIENMKMAYLDGNDPANLNEGIFIVENTLIVVSFYF